MCRVGALAEGRQGGMAHRRRRGIGALRSGRAGQRRGGGQEVLVQLQAGEVLGGHAAVEEIPQIVVDGPAENRDAGSGDERTHSPA